MQHAPSTQVDDSSLPGVPDQRMLALINTYVVHTTELLNSVAASCEQRLESVHSKVQMLDTKLRILEAKVDSAAASMDAALPTIEGYSAAEGSRPSSGLHLRQPPTVEVPESKSPSVHGGSETEEVEEIDINQSTGGNAGASET